MSILENNCLTPVNVYSTVYDMDTTTKPPTATWAHRHRYAPHRNPAWREHYFCAFPGCGIALHGRHLKDALDEGATMATPDDVDRFDAHGDALEAYWKRELGSGVLP